MATEFNDLFGRRAWIRAGLLVGIAAAVTFAFGMSPQGVSADSQAVRPDLRFDNHVRSAMFAGMAGDRESLSRAMKLCEDTLAKNPKHPEALVWHGSGTYTLAGEAFRAGDIAKGVELRDQAVKEMDDAVALLPDSITVLVPRGAALLEGSKHVRVPEQAQALLQKALGDYEKVLALQRRDLSTIDVHSRGELLSALAEGWYRAEDTGKAQAYFRMLVEQTKGSGYAARAQAVLDAANPPKTLEWHCIGCHAGG